MKKILLLLLLNLFALGEACLGISSCMDAYAQQKPNYRDVVYLKNGSVIKGYYKDFNPTDSFRMETIDGGYFVCAPSDILRIAKENTQIYLIQEQPDEGDRLWRKKGYRGFVEFSSKFSLMNVRFNGTGFNTAHGYQFNPYIFTGAGFGIESLNFDINGVEISTADAMVPIFGDVRIYPLKKRISPYLEGRGGYTVWGINGPYAMGALGCDFSISPRFGIFLSAGYIYQGYHYVTGSHQHLNILTIKLGVHF